MERLRVIFVFSSAMNVAAACQADALVRAWQEDAEVDASTVRLSRSSPTAWPALLRRLAGADVIHVLPASAHRGLSHTIPVLALARVIGRPAIVSYGDVPGAGDVCDSPVLRRALGAATGQVVPSDVMADALERLGNRATVIPPLVEPETFPFRERQPFRPRLLSVRDFDPCDNVAATIRAFAVVQHRWSGATLTLVGRGSQEQHLRALADNLALRRVMFAGPVETVDLPAVYADHDIFIQSANVDNGATALLRAFAAGLPVVSTTAGAVPSILTHGVNGLLAPLADYQTLGHHVLRLISSPDYARGLARTAHAACDAYRWPRVREQWLRTYRSVVARPRRSPLTARILESVSLAGGERGDSATERRTS